MQDVVINSFGALHELLEEYDARTVIYRGMKSVQFPLIPKIARLVPPDSVKSREWNEKEILRLFKERSLPYLDFMPTNDWDWLALGQQYGLPARLLDRRRNPLVACYFAVEQPSDGDSMRYAYHNKSFLDVEEHQNPFKYRQVGKFMPRHLTRRAVCSPSTEPVRALRIGGHGKNHHPQRHPGYTEKEPQPVWRGPIFAISRSRQPGSTYRIAPVEGLMEPGRPSL